MIINLPRFSLPWVVSFLCASLAGNFYLTWRYFNDSRTTVQAIANKTHTQFYPVCYDGSKIVKIEKPLSFQSRGYFLATGLPTFVNKHGTIFIPKKYRWDIDADLSLNWSVNASTEAYREFHGKQPDDTTVGRINRCPFRREWLLKKFDERRINRRFAVPLPGGRSKGTVKKEPAE